MGSVLCNHLRCDISEPVFLFLVGTSSFMLCVSINCMYALFVNIINTDERVAFKQTNIFNLQKKVVELKVWMSLRGINGLFKIYQKVYLLRALYLNIFENNFTQRNILLILLIYLSKTVAYCNCSINLA